MSPAPRYPERQIFPHKEQQAIKVKNKEYMERFRNNAIAKGKEEENFLTGRLYAHLGQEEMKLQVQEINKKEREMVTGTRSRRKRFRNRGNVSAP